jgi:hypothetical protein
MAGEVSGAHTFLGDLDRVGDATELPGHVLCIEHRVTGPWISIAGLAHAARVDDHTGGVEDHRLGKGGNPCSTAPSLFV